MRFKDGKLNFMKSSNEEINMYQCNKVINHIRLNLKGTGQRLSVESETSQKSWVIKITDFSMTAWSALVGEKSVFWQVAPVDQSRLQFILSYIRLNQTMCTKPQIWRKKPSFRGYQAKYPLSLQSLPGFYHAQISKLHWWFILLHPSFPSCFLAFGAVVSD